MSVSKQFCSVLSGREWERVGESGREWERVGECGERVGEWESEKECDEGEENRCEGVVAARSSSLFFLAHLSAGSAAIFPTVSGCFASHNHERYTECGMYLQPQEWAPPITNGAFVFLSSLFSPVAED